MLAAVTAAPVQAALTTDVGAIASPITITFDDFDGFVPDMPAPVGGGAIFSASIPSTLGAFIADLGSNGTWGAGNFFAATGELGAGDGFGLLHYSFGDKVTSGAGALLNSYAGGPIFIIAYGANSNILEAHAVSVSTGEFSLNEGAFYGITRASSDIRAIAFGGTGLVMDDFAFTTPVPEPESYAMMLCGLGLVGWALRNRKRKQDATRLRLA